MTVYQKEEVVRTNELERDISGLIQKDTRKKKFKDRSLVIEHYSQLLSNNKLRIGRFLQIMANMDNKIIIQDHEYPTFENATETSSVSETVAANRRSTKKKSNTSTVLTRSKVRKLASQENNMAKKRTASETDFNDATDQLNASKRINVVNDSSLVMSSNARVTSDASASTIATNERLANKNSNISTTLTRAEVRNVSSQEAHSEEVASNDTIDLMYAPHQTNERCDDTDIADIAFSAVTVEIDRLNEYFEKIYNHEVEVHLQTECVMGCKRPRGTVLLPCQHQPTCNQCFVLWRIFVDQKGKKRTTFCPFCRKKVTSTIVVHN